LSPISLSTLPRILKSPFARAAVCALGVNVPPFSITHGIGNDVIRREPILVFFRPREHVQVAIFGGSVEAFVVPVPTFIEDPLDNFEMAASAGIKRALGG
jgi:hypothetical protein